MIRHEYLKDLGANLTAICFEDGEIESTAHISTVEGLGDLKKFVLLDIAKDTPEIILYNATEKEQEKACDLLEKILFDEPSYRELDNLCDSLAIENEKLKEELEYYKEREEHREII